MKVRAGHLVVALILCLTLPAVADPPDRSLRPEARPGAAPSQPAVQASAPPQGGGGVSRVMVHAGAFAPRVSLRPETRPGDGPVPARVAATTAIAAPTTTPPPQIERGGLFGGTARPQGEARVTVSGGLGSQLAVARSVRPDLRPDGLAQRVRATATRQTPARVAQPGQRGALCGFPGLVGERLEPIPGRIAGCGIAEPVRLREVDGVTLSQPATINCDTARALQLWVSQTVIPTIGRRGGGVTSLGVAASYSCRTRNNQPGARLSEHSTGNAIDISAIGLANGSQLTVSDDWRDRTAGPIMRELHGGACGPFGTVLGPDSDRFHQNHFHFDVAAYRSGNYCR